MNLDELLPCPVPWCESDVLEVIRSPFSRGYGVVCQNCRAQGPSLATQAKAIAAWNKRAAPGLIADNRRLAERVAVLEELAHDMLLDLEGTRIFLTTREKMHECGVQMRDDVVSRAHIVLGLAGGQP